MNYLYDCFKNAMSMESQSTDHVPLAGGRSQAVWQKHNSASDIWAPSQLPSPRWLSPANRDAHSDRQDPTGEFILQRQIPT